MTRSIAVSLITCKELDCHDLAERFQKEYFNEPHRGYGENIKNVFIDLRDRKYEDVFESARQQFQGSGSYGNGAAMRVSPIPLFSLNDEDKLIKVATDVAKITHSNQLAITGSVLLALALKLVLCKKPGDSINPQNFIEGLIEKIRIIDTPTKVNKISEKTQVYVDSLIKILKYINNDCDPHIGSVVKDLGNEVSAHRSVPTAIYAFLRGLTPIDGIEENNIFVRVLYYCLLLGGDTDTIASMAGSLAGAYCGFTEIPDNLVSCCESIGVAISQANDLYSIHENNV
ncbi:Poly(ADP-ribose) glycohydrolase ARH3 [Nymphon striatum]|nr:Poly(ADP-ribose) glycohydrolase ARH3 [Nymphon striatum]